MKILFCAIWFGLVLFATTARGEEPGRDLDPQIAKKNRIPEAPVAIIVAGNVREGDFEATHVRRVTSIHPVIEAGRQVRRGCFHDFRWNPAYGWFLAQRRDRRGGEEVWIGSGTEGVWW